MHKPIQLSLELIPVGLESSGCWSFPGGISQLVTLLDTGTRLKVDFSFVHRTSTRSRRFRRCKASASFMKVALFPSLLPQASSKATLHISWLLFSRFMSRSSSKENSIQRPIISQSAPSSTAMSSLISRGHSLSRSVAFNPWRDKISSKLGPGSLTVGLVVAIINVKFTFRGNPLIQPHPLWCVTPPSTFYSTL